MRRYDGDAVVLADEVEYPCSATLHGDTDRLTTQSFEGTDHVHGLTDWGGSINVGDEGAAWAVQQAGDRQLRIGDRESGFIMTGGDLSTGVLRIKGSGDIPFD